MGQKITIKKKKYWRKKSSKAMPMQPESEKKSLWDIIKGIFVK